jgi:hypothetical protein
MFPAAALAGADRSIHLSYRLIKEINHGPRHW